jgi:hypothetical protein
MTRKQFLSAVGLAAISLVALRVETLQSTLRAIVPEEAHGADAYGQSAYGA